MNLQKLLLLNTSMNFESKYYFVDFEILFRLFLHSHHFQRLNSMAMLILKSYAMYFFKIYVNEQDVAFFAAWVHAAP